MSHGMLEYFLGIIPPQRLSSLFRRGDAGDAFKHAMRGSLSREPWKLTYNT